MIGKKKIARLSLEAEDIMQTDSITNSKIRLMKLIQREATGSIATKSDSLLNRVFAKRGINDSEELGFELKQLHSISQLKGIQDAVDIVVEAFDNKSNIVIVGDFDADGATSTVVVVRALESI